MYKAITAISKNRKKNSGQILVLGRIRDVEYGNAEYVLYKY